MCAEDTNLEIVIKLHNQGLNEVLPKIKGKVVRCTAAYNNQGYFLGVRFYDVPEKAKNVLLKLVGSQSAEQVDLQYKEEELT
jgi:hypothetical protein